MLLIHGNANSEQARGMGERGGGGRGKGWRNAIYRYSRGG